MKRLEFPEGVGPNDEISVEDLTAEQCKKVFEAILLSWNMTEDAKLDSLTKIFSRHDRGTFVYAWEE